MKSQQSPPICLKIEEKHFPGLIQEVGDILNETGSHKGKSFDSDFWDWQYRRLPSGECHIYAVLHNDKIRGYYHVPVYSGLIAGKKKRFAMVQEVAISRALRGQHMFRKLAECATADLKKNDIDFIYTFPNIKSIHTFLKYNGYNRVLTFDNWILPTRISAILASKCNLFGLKKIAFLEEKLLKKLVFVQNPGGRIQVSEGIDDGVVGVFLEYQKEHVIALYRDTSYLRWRFNARPHSNHYCFSLSLHGRTVAAAIFKIDTLFGNPALILMDFAFLAKKERYLLVLLEQVKISGERLIGKEFNFIFASGHAAFLSRLKRIGFIRVPEKFTPRPLHLLVKSSYPSPRNILSPRNWHLTLADWDVF